MTISIDTLIETYNSRFSEKPKIIFEIGAREAADSIKLKKTFPLSSVYAFEAHPVCYQKHKDNVLAHGIKYYNFGMWSSEKELIFYDKGSDTGISSFRNRGDQYGLNKFSITTKTPYDFCESNNIDQIDILKLDVEGCSYEILMGFGEYLEKINLMHIETEQQQHFSGQYLESEVFSLLEKDFEIISHSHCCLSQYDSIWIRK